MRPRMHPERIVVKIGTSSLITDGRLDPDKADALASDVAELTRAGLRPVLVASGAIALGSAQLASSRESGASGEPGAEARQLAAAVGQGPLFEAFRTRLARHGLTAAQFLFTPVDFVDEQHREGMAAVLAHALASGVVPVVNENDAVRVRNNDTLAALLSVLLRARLLVLLTDVPGLYGSDPRTDPAARLIPEVKGMTPEVERLAGASGEGPGTGGMVSKLGAVWIATMAGVTAAIAWAQQPEVLPRLLRGDAVGTVVHPWPTVQDHGIEQLWRAFADPPRGTVVCRDTAEAAVAGGDPVQRRSVLRAEGRFAPGDVVDVVLEGARVIARGRTRIGSRSLNEAGSADRTGDRTGDATVLHHSEYVSLLEVS